MEGSLCWGRCFMRCMDKVRSTKQLTLTVACRADADCTVDAICNRGSRENEGYTRVQSGSEERTARSGRTERDWLSLTINIYRNRWYVGLPE